MALQPSIFEGFTRVEESQLVSGGAQKKDPYSGIYINDKDKRRYYIKRTESYVADDITEVVSSRMLEALVGRVLAIPYKFVKQHNGSIYVASEIREDAVTLKKEAESPLAFGANPITDKNKQKIDDAMKTPKQRSQLARILSGCLLLRDYDVQIGNLVLYGKEQDRNIAKFDNGWALAGICKDKCRRVDLFGARSPAGKGAHGFGPVPTNHFNDYLLTNSQEFIDGMEEVIQEYDPRKMSMVIKNAMDEVKDEYKEANVKDALFAFAKHIGLMSEGNVEQFDFNVMSENEIDNLIFKKLEKRIQQRTHSMRILKIFLEMNLSLKTKPSVNAKTLPNLISKLRSVIQQNLTHKNGYLLDETLEDILPKFKPSTAKLLHEILNSAKKQGVNAEGIAFLEDLGNLNITLGELLAKLKKSDVTRDAAKNIKHEFQTVHLRQAPIPIKPSQTPLVFDVSSKPKTIVLLTSENSIDEKCWKDVKDNFSQKNKKAFNIDSILNISSSAMQVTASKTQTKLEKNQAGILEVSSTKFATRVDAIDYEDMALRFRQAALFTHHSTCALKNVYDSILPLLVSGLLREDGIYTRLPKIVPKLSPDQIQLLDKTPAVKKLYTDAIKKRDAAPSSQMKS